MSIRSKEYTGALSPSAGTEVPHKIHIVQYSQEEGWEDFTFTSEEWPDLEEEVSFRLMLVDSDKRNRDVDDVRTDVEKILQIPDTLDADFFWDYDNTWGCFASGSEWSDDVVSPRIVKQTTAIMQTMNFVSEDDDIAKTEETQSKQENEELDAPAPERTSTQSGDAIESFPDTWLYTRFLTEWDVSGTVKAAVIDFPDAWLEPFLTVLKKTLDLSASPYEVYSIAMITAVDIHRYGVGVLRAPQFSEDEIEDQTPGEERPILAIFEDLHMDLRNILDNEESLGDGIQTLRHVLDSYEAFYRSQETSHRVQRRKSHKKGDKHSTNLLTPKTFYMTTERLLNHSRAFKTMQNHTQILSRRIQNNIDLVFNNIAQRDASVSVDLAKVSTRDSASMKVIAFVTVLFLPATFVSAIFGTNFFVPPSGQKYTLTDRMQVSGNFWIYWAFSVPLTLICAIGGLLWHQRELINDKYTGIWKKNGEGDEDATETMDGEQEEQLDSKKPMDEESGIVLKTVRTHISNMAAKTFLERNGADVRARASKPPNSIPKRGTGLSTSNGSGRYKTSTGRLYNLKP